MDVLLTVSAFQSNSVTQSGLPSAANLSSTGSILPGSIATAGK